MMNMMNKKMKEIQIVANLIKKKELQLLYKYNDNFKTTKNELKRFIKVTMYKLKQKVMNKINLITSFMISQSVKQQICTEIMMFNKENKMRKNSTELTV